MIFLQVFLGAMLAHVVFRVGVKTVNSIAFWYLTRKMGKAQVGLPEIGLGQMYQMDMCKCSCGASHPKMHTCTTCGREHPDWGQRAHQH